MKFRTLAAAVAALSLTATPVLAQSTDLVRASAPLVSESDAGGSSTLLLVLAVALMGLGIYFLVDNDDDTPNSP